MKALSSLKGQKNTGRKKTCIHYIPACLLINLNDQKKSCNLENNINLFKVFMLTETRGVFVGQKSDVDTG